jgi:multidrug resistance efflux pump
MSEDRTQNLPHDDLRQILAQLTSTNSQLSDVRARLERLEARDYDTKPIWEHALKEIADTRAEMREGFGQVNARVDKVQAGVDEARAETLAGLRKMGKQIEVLNNNILGMEAEMRLLDERMGKLEPQPAP